MPFHSGECRLDNAFSLNTPRNEYTTGHQTWSWNTKPDVHGNYWDLVCVDFEGNRLLPGQDRHAWKEFLRRNDVPEIRVHDARHTAATTLLGLGVAPRIVMQMMGWSSMAMLNRYQHVLDEMEREAASKVGEAIFSAQIISLDERRELA